MSAAALACSHLSFVSWSLALMKICFLSSFLLLCLFSSSLLITHITTKSGLRFCISARSDLFHTRLVSPLPSATGWRGELEAESQASTSAKRPEPCGSSLSVWSALTKLSWCEKHQWVTVVTLPNLKQCLQAAAPPAARTHSRLTALQTGR